VNPDEAILDEIRFALVEPHSGEIKARRTAEIIRPSCDYRLAGIYEIDREKIAAIEMQ
jgi:hypothetical protein